MNLQGFSFEIILIIVYMWITLSGDRRVSFLLRIA